MTPEQEAFSIRYENYLRTIGSTATNELADYVGQQRQLIKTQQFQAYSTLVDQTFAL